MPRRSHPPSLMTLTRRLVVDERLFGRGDRVLCAVSGGPDSTALLHVLALLRGDLGHALVAVGVDHGLRGEASAELALAERVARDACVPFEVIRLEVASGSNLQARARLARHAALQDAARRLDITTIALGHTRDDRAETLLIRLLRGAGPRGLAVMPPRAPCPTGTGVELVRPLLLARRADVLAHVARSELACADDPSNRDRRFLRARVRHELIPLLEELSPGVVEHLAELAEMLAALPTDEGLAPFGRAQRQQITRAIRLGRRYTTLRLPGGRDVTVEISEKTSVPRDER
ncbi:MAG: tRNA lysidine(34) synthetase TilS [Myxococcales bacterium]|nr:tRNA lysidine(34) synthetase TilS [Myxococcales bacterium]